MEGKKKIIDAIKKQNEELIEEIEYRMTEMLDTPLYEEFFWITLQETLKKVDSDYNTIIGMIKKDYDRYGDKLKNKYGIECKIIEDKFIGGLILENENIIIDNTLKNAIEEKVIKRSRGE